MKIGQAMIMAVARGLEVLDHKCIYLLLSTFPALALYLLLSTFPALALVLMIKREAKVNYIAKYEYTL